MVEPVASEPGEVERTARWIGRPRSTTAPRSCPFYHLRNSAQSCRLRKCPRLLARDHRDWIARFYDHHGLSDPHGAALGNWCESRAPPRAARLPAARTAEASELDKTTAGRRELTALRIERIYSQLIAFRCTEQGVASAHAVRVEAARLFRETRIGCRSRGGAAGLIRRRRAIHHQPRQCRRTWCQAMPMPALRSADVDAARATPQTSRTAPRASPSVSTSRSRCASSWSSVSGWSGVGRFGCSRPSIRAMQQAAGRRSRFS